MENKVKTVSILQRNIGVIFFGMLALLSLIFGIVNTLEEVIVYQDFYGNYSESRVEALKTFAENDLWVNSSDLNSKSISKWNFDGSVGALSGIIFSIVSMLFINNYYKSNR